MFAVRRQQLPAGVPVLTAGRHRRPSAGACVMEYTSVLAGERWTDRPACVCPALASLARTVNDRVGDTARQRLALLAVDCIDTADVDIGVRLSAARRALTTALAHARDDHARFTILVGLVAVDRAAGRDVRLPEHRRRFPGLSAAAERFVAQAGFRDRDFLHRGLPAAFAAAIEVIADSPRTTDDVLVGVLATAIHDYRTALLRTHLAATA